MLKSRTEWIMEGVRNAKFFHVSTLVNRHRNKIRGLRTPEGEWTYDQEGLMNLINGFFKNLYKSNKVSVSRTNIQRVEIDVQENRELSETRLIPISHEEVWRALKCFKPYKVPGPDGLHSAFFQKFWHITGGSMVDFVKKVFETSKIPDGMNDTLISLIPKCPNLEMISQLVQYKL